MTVEILSDALPVEPAVSATDWPEHFARRASQGGDALTAILSLAASTDVITFSGGFPAPETFPVDVLRRLSAELLDDEAAVALQYSPTEGLPMVRGAVSDMLVSGQGRAPEDVLITSGGIEALQLLARTFIDTGDLVMVEAPTYLGAIMAFAGFEAQVVGIPIDDGGLRVDELEASLVAGHRPKLLYVIPEHQNPTGLSLAVDRRAALVDVCRRHGVLIVEDVAYRDLGFDGQAAPSLWSLGPDVVVQIGTFSKVFTPGVRLGWAVGPGAGDRGDDGRQAELRPVLRCARSDADGEVRLRRPSGPQPGGCSRPVPRARRDDDLRPRATHARRRAVDHATRRLLRLAHGRRGRGLPRALRSGGAAGRRLRPGHAVLHRRPR